MVSEQRKEYMRNYLKSWREKNKKKVKKYRKKNQKKYMEKDINALNRGKYVKLRFNCLFCNKSHLIRNKKRHNNSSKHKKNILNFNKLLLQKCN